MQANQSIFNTTQKTTARHLYALFSHFSEEQLKGALSALITIQVLVEDGYISLNRNSLEVDFYAHCYDVLLGSTLALKMLRDDGVITQDLENSGIGVKFNPNQNLKEVDLALARTETLIKYLDKVASETIQ